MVILVLIIAQTALGFVMLGHVHGLKDVHGILGYINFIAAIAAAWFAFQASREDARSKGLFMHATSLPVLCLIQIGIIEASGGTGALKWVHVVLGLAYLLATAALWTLTGKRMRELR